jgi:hypothetical protein
MWELGRCEPHATHRQLGTRYMNVIARYLTHLRSDASCKACCVVKVNSDWSRGLPTDVDIWTFCFTLRAEYGFNYWLLPVKIPLQNNYSLLCNLCP